jgi:hypothetical protein
MNDLPFTVERIAVSPKARKLHPGWKVYQDEFCHIIYWTPMYRYDCPKTKSKRKKSW